MAGLAKMPARTFFVSLACGTIPVGFTYAAAGFAGISHPGWAVALSSLLPALFWLGARPGLKRPTSAS